MRVIKPGMWCKLFGHSMWTIGTSDNVKDTGCHNCDYKPEWFLSLEELCKQEPRSNVIKGPWKQKGAV